MLLYLPIIVGVLRLKCKRQFGYNNIQYNNGDQIKAQKPVDLIIQSCYWTKWWRDWLNMSIFIKVVYYCQTAFHGSEYITNESNTVTEGNLQLNFGWCC